MSEFATVWDDAGASAEQAAEAKAMGMAKQASADIKTFLFQAENETDFGHRIALAEDDLMKAAAEGGISVHALVAEHTREFDLLMEAKRSVATKEDFGDLPEDAPDRKPTGPHPQRDNPDYWVEDDAEKKTAGKPQVCPGCNGARAVPAQGHESYHEVSNGHVRCPDCAGHGVVQAGPDTSELTTHERWGDATPYEQDPGDAQDAHYSGDYTASLKQAEASLASLRTALQEGQDPLEWLEEQANGEGQAEKPSEAGIEALEGGKQAKKAVPPFSREAASGYYDRENLSPGEVDEPDGQHSTDRSGPGPAVHTFNSTGEAYNRSQYDDSIKDGDVLHVPSEGVTGFLQDAWPIALHHNGSPGEFHGLNSNAGEDVHSLFGGGAKGQEHGLKDYSETLAKAKQVHEGLGKQGSMPPF